MSIATNFPTIKPSLLLDFANVGALDPRITFTRSTTATYYDGVTTAKAEENLFVESQTLNTTWGTVACSVTANTDAAPDGTTTADTLTANGVSGTHALALDTGIPSGQTRTMSVFAKAGTNNFIQLAFGGDATPYANFDLSGGTIGNSASVTASIVDFGGGWYRCIVTTTSVAATGARFFIITNGTSARGESNSLYTTVILWGAQMELRSAVTAYTATTDQPITNYIPVLQTAAANVARFDHNPTTGEALGLLIEEQRTNLWLQSEDFSTSWTPTNLSVTTNTVVSPAGTLTGEKLVENTSSSVDHIIAQNTAVTSGVTYTMSVYAKQAESGRYLALRFASGTYFSAEAATFNLSTGAVLNTFGTTTATITSVGNGWYRCSITAVSKATGTPAGAQQILVTNSTSATVFSYTGDGYSGIFLWGAQLEAGAFPTSYIATTSAQVTRSADAASMTGTNFSSWFNAGESTVYSEFMRNTTANAIAGGGYTVPRIYSFGTSASGNLQLRLFASTGAEATGPSMYISNTWAANQYNKHALAFEVNDAALVRDGGSVVSDSTVTALTADTLAIGQNTIGSGNIGQGWIRKLSYYPQRLTDAQLQAITS